MLRFEWFGLFFFEISAAGCLFCFSLVLTISFLFPSVGEIISGFLILFFLWQSAPHCSLLLLPALFRGNGFVGLKEEGHLGVAVR